MMEDRSQYPNTAAHPPSGYGPPDPRYGPRIPPQPQPGFAAGPPPGVPLESSGRRQPDGSRPKRRFGPVKITLIVIFSPFIALYFAVKWLFWCLAWLLTPPVVAVHLLLWPFGCLWFGLVRLCGATGRSRFRMFQPVPPRFPGLTSGFYWRKARRVVTGTGEALLAIGEFLGELLN